MLCSYAMVPIRSRPGWLVRSGSPGSHVGHGAPAAPAATSAANDSTLLLSSVDSSMKRRTMSCRAWSRASASWARQVA